MRLRLSLRTLFAVVTVMCIVLGTKVMRATQQRRAVEWVEDQGGTITYQHIADWIEDLRATRNTGRNPPRPDASGPLWLRERIGIDYFESVVYVQLNDLPVDSISTLSGLRQTKRLMLDGADVTDLRPIAGLTSIEVLLLGRTPATNLSPLARLRSLTLLDLNSTNVSDITPLAKLTKLKTLNLRFTEVSDVTSSTLR